MPGRYITGIGDTHAEFTTGDTAVSIVRQGMAETKNYGSGYDAIFGKKSATAKKPAAKKPAAKKPAKKAGKKK